PMRTAPAAGPGREMTRVGPGVFDGLRLAAMDLRGEGEGTTAGVVLDARARTATAVLALRGNSFALMSAADQEARVAAWASVLASLAREGSDVHRVQWVERSLPDAGGAVRRYFEDRCARAGSAAARSYGTLLDEAAPVTRRHRVLLAVSVHTSRSARAIRRSVGGDAGCGDVLGREARALQRALEGADVWVDGLLGPAALAAAVREAVLPAASAGRGGGGPALDGHRPAPPLSAGGAAPPAPWPLAVRPEWDAVLTDGTWHATYWIAEWPRIEVTPDFLGPLLFSPDRRSICLVMEPVSPIRAARQVARARTADVADVELRRRGGFLVGARQHRERHSVEQRDAELADGHAQFRFAGYVSLTADSREGLDAAAVGLEQLAGQSHLELRRLYGEQDVALTCTLPIGRGLP
ncbi:MAG TPA: SCO6880 family protein, partial [Acidimicrobiales bacterium]|nr:SCO6880 family protein [Acidimicrobiales bacterium]